MLELRNRWLRAPWLALLITLSIALGFSLAANFYQSHTATAAPASSAPTTDWRYAFEDIAERMAPSVVYITSESMVDVSSRMPNLEDFFKFGPFNAPRKAPETQKQLRKASGSGVIVRSDGYILTNDHVIAGADRVTVRLSDGREFKGEVLRDPRTDLALVKINADNLDAAQLADSDKVKVGQWAVAIGSPFRLRNTVTVGVVSAVRREVDPDDPLPYPEVIQTDAAINFGNSGGPLVDIDGRVMGINGAIYSPAGGNIGIGFAIPSNTAKFVMTQLIEKGKVVRGYLGVEMQDLSPVLAEKLGVQHGALVTNVTSDSAAEKGGIQVKDVIVEVNGKKVGGGSELRHAVEVVAPGTEVKVVVVRDKKEKTLTVKLGEAPSGKEQGSEKGSNKLGLSVIPLTPDLAKELEIDAKIKGVVVRSVEPGSSADRAGLQEKDVIMEVDDTPVTSVASFTKATEKLKSGDTAIVVVQRGERSVIIELAID